MDDFVRLPHEERRVYFEQAAAQLGFSAQVVEKDFWVCWSLKRLFELAEFLDHLTFKGGTSLSKVYKLIERFSEDVDVSIDRTFLGFGGDKEPEAASSRKKQQRRIVELSEACKATIRERLTPQFHAAVSEHIPDRDHWNLEIDPGDEAGQTLLFRYPAAAATELGLYFPASVKIELGARSDHFPVEKATVTPYMCRAIPDAIADTVATVRVLGAERTFWEKVTILHMLHHLPVEKNIMPRMSRHYYDVFQLSNSVVLNQAMQNTELLKRVATHKGVFFTAAWASYETACPGTLRLIPTERVLNEMRRDYAAMRPMFFNEPPTFDQVLDNLRRLENRINTSA